MKIEEIRLDVFKQTGQSIDADDPFFVALAMLSATATGIENNNLAALAEMRRLCEELTHQAEANKTAGSIHSNFETVFSTQLKIFARVATRIEKNAERNSLLTYCVVMVGVVASFGGGVLFSSNAISANWVFGGMLGATIGSGLTFFAINRIKNKYGEDLSIAVQKNSIQEPTNVWTEAEFFRISQSLNITTSDRTLSACRDVLVNKMEVDEVAKIYNTLPAQITRCLFALRSKR